MIHQNYSRQVLWLILIVSCIKILTASLIELGNDEVYYWTYALQPDWNHFDHPPMVGWLIRLTTFNLNWVSALSLRLGSIIGSALATWWIFRTGKLIASERAGWYAAVIYQCSVYTGIISGLFILPDSPQMPFWTLALYLMAYLYVKDKEHRTGIWVLLGLVIGLATLSKVHGVFLWAGFGLCLLVTRPKWLLNYRLYLSVFITVICLVPIVYWNFQNNFITYRYHSARVTHSQIEWDMLGREIAGEGLYQNPVIFFFLILALIALLRHKIHFRMKQTGTWLLCMSLPMIVVFWGVSLFNPTLPHWSGPAYIPLFLLGAVYLDKRSVKTIPAVLGASAGLVLLVLVIGVAAIRFSPVNFGSHQKENYGEYGPTLDLSGWADFSEAFTRLVQHDRDSGMMKKNSPILVNKWFPGGHLEFYTSRASGLRILAVGKLDDVHKFAWLNETREPLHIGDDAYVIVPSNLPENVKDVYGSLFTEILPPVVILQRRGGGVVRYFYVYRLKHCRQVPASILGSVKN